MNKDPESWNEDESRSYLSDWLLTRYWFWRLDLVVISAGAELPRIWFLLF